MTVATTTVRWRRLRPQAEVAKERQERRKRGMDPDATNPRYPLFYTRFVTPEDHGTSRGYEFSRANEHTVAMPEMDAQVLLYGDDGDEFEAIPD